MQKLIFSFRIAMARPNRFMNNQYNAFPDDNSDKEVVFQKDSRGVVEFEKHVLFNWYNGQDAKGNPVSQIVQLTGNPGAYAFYHPLAKLRNQASLQLYITWSLGVLTRPQRELLVQLASQIEFDMKGTTNNCQVWSADLLYAAYWNRIITNEVYERVMSQAALKPKA